MPLQIPDLTSRIGLSLVRLTQGMRGLLWAEARTLNLSPTQAQCLLTLLAAPQPPTVSALAEQFGTGAATVSEVLTGLERKALVERRHSEEDRRQVHLLLTDQGRAAATRLTGWDGPLAEAVADLPADERRILYRAVLTLVSSLERLGHVGAHACPGCTYFQPACPATNQGPVDPARPYGCALTHLRLADFELRVDCPDFVALTSRP